MNDRAQRNVLLWLALCLSISSVSFSGFGRVYPRIPQGFDFMQFYAGVTALGLGMRDIWLGADYHALATELSSGRWRVPNAYFPGFFVLMLPFGALTFDNAFLVFTTLTLGFYLLVTSWLGQRCFVQRPAGTLFGALLAVFTVFTGSGIDCLCLGQVGFLIAGLISLTYLLGELRYPMLAGVSLGLASLIKAWPALLLLHFLLRRQWRGLWGFALGYGVPSLVGVYLWGVDLYFYLYRGLKSFGYQPSPVNQSLTGWLTYSCGLSHVAAIPLHLVAAMLLVAGMAWLQSSKPKFPRSLFYSLLVLFACLLAPWSWPHHRLALVFPLLVMLERTTRREQAWNWLGVAALSALFCLDGEIVIHPLAAYLHQVAAESGLIFLLMVSAIVCILFAGWNEKEDEVVHA